MKKALLLLLVWTLSSLTALRADVATREPIRMKQPDGSTITLRLHGDEYLHWYTDLNGNVYSRDRQGWWRRSSQPAVKPEQVAEAKRLRRMRDELFVPATKAQTGRGLGWGSNHFLIILVEFSDQPFQDGGAAYFTAMLNESGYSKDGAVGSARDYWVDASGGRFTPSFDVYGPVTLDRKHNEFPENDSEEHFQMARTMITEALEKLDAGTSIDFSQYDNDKDGVIDNIYMFYPGYAQSNGGDEDTIWPHASALRTEATYDGVTPYSYACSSELNGNSGTTFNGCGTFCHEFGHVIGLPDLYDTDYEENGTALDPGGWNLMAGGNHLVGGRVPAGFSTYERYMLGYLDKFEDISKAGSYTLPSVTSNRAFILPTTNEGEMFLLEVRDKKKWDSGLSPGLLIYHVDASDHMVAGISAKDRMDYGYDINCYAEHPCFYIIPPVDDENHNTYYELWVLPKDEYNYHNITETQPRAWSGLKQYNISNISYANGEVTLTIAAGRRQVSGKITTTHANGISENIAGATVLVLPAAQAAPATKAAGKSIAARDVGLPLEAARRQALYQTVTKADGSYSFNLGDNDQDKLVVAVYATDYLSAEAPVSGRFIEQNFDLTPVVSGAEGTFLTQANLPVISTNAFGTSSPGSSFALAHKFTADELKSYAGKAIKTIEFSTLATGEEVYVIVESGGNRLLTRRVSQVSGAQVASDGRPGNKIDISDSRLTVPSGKDLTVGYMVKNSNEAYFMVTDNGPARTGGFMVATFDANKACGDWEDLSEDLGCNLFIGMSFSEQSAINEKATLSDMGISYIALPTTQLKAGDTFQLELVRSESRNPSSVAWYCDFVKLDGTSVKLSAGTHVIQALLSFEDGDKDMLELRLDVKE